MVGAWSEYKDEHEADEADWNVSLWSFVILIIIITIFIIVKIIQNIMTIVLIGPKIDRDSSLARTKQTTGLQTAAIKRSPLLTKQCSLGLLLRDYLKADKFWTAETNDVSSA